MTASEPTPPRRGDIYIYVYIHTYLYLYTYIYRDQYVHARVDVRTQMYIMFFRFIVTRYGRALQNLAWSLPKAGVILFNRFQGL